MIDLKVLVVANNLYWPTLPAALKTAKQNDFDFSRGRINTQYDLINVSMQPEFENYEWAGTTWGRVKIPWYDQNITTIAKGYHMTVFLMEYGEGWNSQPTGYMDWANANSPVRIAIQGAEYEMIGVDSKGNPQMNFLTLLFHEALGHGLRWANHQTTSYQENGQWKFVTHDYLYQNPAKRIELLDQINWETLKANLQERIALMDFRKIQGEATIVVKEGNDYYGLAIPPELWEYTKAKYQIPDQIQEITRAEYDANKKGIDEVGIVRKEF